MIHSVVIREKPRSKRRRIRSKFVATQVRQCAIVRTRQIMRKLESDVLFLFFIFFLMIFLFYSVQSLRRLSGPSAGFRRSASIYIAETTVDEKTQSLNSIQYSQKTCKRVYPDLHNHVALPNISLVGDHCV